jgi:hypothetical protein
MLSMATGHAKSLRAGRRTISRLARDPDEGPTAIPDDLADHGRTNADSRTNTSVAFLPRAPTRLLCKSVAQINCCGDYHEAGHGSAAEKRQMGRVGCGPARMSARATERISANDSHARERGRVAVVRSDTRWRRVTHASARSRLVAQFSCCAFPLDSTSRSMFGSRSGAPDKFCGPRPLSNFPTATGIDRQDSRLSFVIVPLPMEEC